MVKKNWFRGLIHHHRLIPLGSSLLSSMLARKNPDFVRILSDYFAFLTFYLIVIVMAIGSCDMRLTIFFSFRIDECSACVTIGISCVF